MSNQSAEPTGARHGAYGVTANTTVFFSGENLLSAPVAYLIVRPGVTLFREFTARRVDRW
jgi:hypothetical protein